ARSQVTSDVRRPRPRAHRGDHAEMAAASRTGKETRSHVVGAGSHHRRNSAVPRPHCCDSQHPRVRESQRARVESVDVSPTQHSVIPCSANLLATYAVPPSKPRCAAVEATLTMFPYFLPTKCRADSRATTIAPKTFVAKTLCMSASSSSSSGANEPKPALLTR